MSLKLAATSDEKDKHEYDITSLIFKNDKVYSAADDGKIKMWNMDLKLEKEVQAHPCSVYSLTADNGEKIYSCSSDGSVRVWKAGTLEEAGVFQEPGEREMWKIYWADDTFFILDDQGIIRVFRDNKMLVVIEMLEQIKDITFKDNLLYSVRDLDLVITEIVGGKKCKFTCRRTLPGRAPLVLIDDKLCFSSRDGRELLINYRNIVSNFAEVTKIQNAHELVINAINGGRRGDDSILVSGGWDKKVKQWLITSSGATPAGSCEVDGYINAICVSEDCTKIFAGGAEGKIWKVDAQ